MSKIIKLFDCLDPDVWTRCVKPDHCRIKLGADKFILFLCYINLNVEFWYIKISEI